MASGTEKRVENEIQAAIARLGGDVQLYKELVQCFLDDSAGLMPGLRTAIENRDADALHRAAHSLKGLAASCGAPGVLDAASRLERFGRDKTLEMLDPAWQALEAAFNAAAIDLADYYSSN